jgi:hypothetical protein
LRLPPHLSDLWTRQCQWVWFVDHFVFLLFPLLVVSASLPTWHNIHTWIVPKCVFSLPSTLLGRSEWVNYSDCRWRISLVPSGFKYFIFIICSFIV